VGRKKDNTGSQFVEHPTITDAGSFWVEIIRPDAKHRGAKSVNPWA